MYYSDKLRLVKGNLSTIRKIINELIGKKNKISSQLYLRK